MFNLDQDPGEQYNVADEHPDIIAMIQEIIAEHNASMK